MGSFDKQLLRNRASPTPPEMLESNPSVNAVRCRAPSSPHVPHRPATGSGRVGNKGEREERAREEVTGRAHEQTHQELESLGP